jgi:hypothetical protein
MGKVFFRDDLFNYTSINFDFLGQQIRQGHFPLWNPFLMGGTPYFANANTMSVYPLAYLILLFPTGHGMPVFVLIHWLIAASGMHFFLQNKKLSQWACKGGALTYACSGFFWWEVVHLPIIAVFAWIPWWTAYLERTVQGRNMKDAFRTGLAFSILFLSCHYQMTLMAVYGALIYVIFCLAASWRYPALPPIGIKKGLLAVGFVLWGLIPAFLWLIPAGESILHSERFRSTFDYQQMNMTGFLNPRKIYQFLFPINPIGTTMLEYPDFIDDLGFLGLFAPVLFYSAFRRPTSRLWAWVVLSLIGLALALGPVLPIHRWACDHLPGFRFTRGPSRAMVLYCFSGCVLAAVGLENILSQTVNKKGLKFLLLTSLIVSLLVPVWTSVPWGDAAILTAVHRAPVLSRLEETPVFSRVFIWPDIPFPIHWRGSTYFRNFPPNAAMTSGIRVANGYDSQFLENYSLAWKFPTDTFTRLLAIHWMVSGTGKSGMELGELIEDHPFVWAAGKGTVLTETDVQHQALAKPEFDPYRETILSEPVSPGYLSGEKKKIPVRWTGQDLGPNEEKFQIELIQPALTVFSEVYFTGWQAYLDGAPTHLYEADGLLRAVAVPAGKHEIRFRYRPIWLIPCLTAALLWLLSLPAAFWVLHRKGQRFKEWDI